MIASIITRRSTQRLALLVAAALVASATSARAQSAQGDPRWQPWVGCWRAQHAGVGAPVICVVPAAGTSAVDIATIDGDSVIAREHLDANGLHVAKTKDGCAGWQSATWSDDGRRVYTSSEYNCAGGVTRASNGLMSFAPGGDWLDVQAVKVGAGSGVRAQRYLSAAAIPNGVAGDLGAALRRIDHTPGVAVSPARTAASARVTQSEIIDASRHLDAAVVSAWLVERRQRFSVDARQLVELADARVPDRVIDALVALSYPRQFAIDGGAGDADIRRAEQPERGGVASDSDWGYGYGPTAVMYPSYYDPYGYAPYGYGAGLSPYGYSNGFGWYPIYGPVIVVRDAAPQPHGRVVNGRGYQAPEGGSPSGSSGTSGSTGSTSGSSGASSGSTGRTAHPKP
ncbi:MAG: hypothetical protein M3081_05025 [Gemmatimonadota bacterium]|nr:hypothetical protein [Gemmatimonadota bacterium]